MFETSLTRAVERFVDVTHAAPDAALEREWTWGAYDSEGVRFAFFRTYEELRELAAKTATARAARGPATSAAQRILAQYHAAYRDLQATLLGIGEDEANRAPAEKEWPVREIVGHIAGADVGFFVVTKYALERRRSDDGQSAEIPDEFWEAAIGQDGPALRAALDGPLAGIREVHQTFHERVVRQFADITEEELTAPSMYWEGYELPLRFRLHRFDSHLRQHTIQVDKTLDAIDHAPNEAKRLSRLLYAALAEVEAATIGAWDVGTETWDEVAKAISARADEITGLL